ncbi:unnamed protein product [Caenorhabditis auriculariae]|uniref:Uncharacterized protein n=1 Tax=Caenorhabditis auriculariae TaxID=2777116 RepID=A0A8S1HRW4_9PELO|nr:unnamed protein product [Caenorhabditis auriculariae]
MSAFRRMQHALIANITRDNRNMSLLDTEDLTGGEIIFADDVQEESSLIADLFRRPSSLGNNLTGLVILSIVLTAIAIIFFGCYLMMRFMHRALSSDDTKDMLAASNQYRDVVIHSKRVYEIQAEEGCFSGPPDPLDPSGDLDKDDLKEKSGSATSLSSVVDEEEKKLKKPEQGDLRAIRSGESYDDDPRAMLRKKQKVHKDSVCAFLFRPEPEPRMV